MKDALWSRLRKSSPILFPIFSVLLTILILTTPLYEERISGVISNNFIRFVLFWLLGLFILFSFTTTKIRPWRIAFRSTLLCSIVIALYCVIASHVHTVFSFTDVLFDSMAGALLGALAGTWGKYVLEVYNDTLLDD